MDPITLIVGALVAGAMAGVTDSAADAVKSAYSALKEQINELFRAHGDSTAEIALEHHAADPQTWKNPLEKALVEHGATEDPAIIAKSQDLLALTDPKGFEEGKYTIDLRGAQGVQAGDHNTQTNYFGEPGRH